MSKFLKPCQYEGRALENQWVNEVFTSHDLFCGCMNPVQHLNAIIDSQKCLRFKDVATTTEIGGTQENDDLGIDDGDLATLFDEGKESTG